MIEPIIHKIDGWCKAETRRWINPDGSCETICKGKRIKG